MSAVSQQDLERQIAELTVKIADLQKKSIEKDAELQRLAEIDAIGKSHAQRLDFMAPFSATIRNGTGYEGGFGGSYLRQMFELPFALRDKKFAGYADPRGHDLDYYVCDHREDNTAKTSDDITHALENFVSKLQSYMMVRHLNPHKISAPKIGAYTLFEIVKQRSVDRTYARDVPSYIMKFYDDDKKVLKVDVLGWHPNTFAKNGCDMDFNVNSVVVNDSGIRCMGYFFDILTHISKKEAQCIIPFEEIIQPRSSRQNRKTTMEAIEKVTCFLQDRCKIFSFGYERFSSTVPTIHLAFEQKDDCHITQAEPPYIKVQLRCGHFISIMALSGMPKSDNRYSEKIICSLCRAGFEFRLSAIEPTSVKSFDPNWEKFVDKEEKLEVHDEVPVLSRQLIGEAAQEQIELLKKPAEEVAPEIPEDID